jgi:hypothetical protein
MAIGKPTSERYPGVEFREVRGRWQSGYLNIAGLAEVLGCSTMTLTKFVRAGAIKPDFFNRTAIFFSIGRLEEIISLWQNKETLSRDSAPVRGVITRFGMMLPCAKPNAEVLKRLILSRPKRPSRDSSWRTRRRYNLKDLTP